MKTIKSRKLVIAIIAIAAIVAIALGVKTTQIIEISSALVALITAMHLIIQGNLDAKTITSAAASAQQIAQVIVPTAAVSVIPVSTITEAVNTATDAGTAVSDAIETAIQPAIVVENCTIKTAEEATKIGTPGV